MPTRKTQNRGDKNVFSSNVVSRLLCKIVLKMVIAVTKRSTKRNHKVRARYSDVNADV